MNVDRDIFRALTAKQFMNWWHYAELEPFRELRADYRAAFIVQAILNVNRGKDQKMLTLEEVIQGMKFEDHEPKKEQTWQQKLAIARLMAEQAALLHRRG